jgi:choline kinase
MKIVILAAGMGSRLLPYTKDIPKAKVNIFGKSIIDHQLSILKSFKLDNICIVSGYCHQKFSNYNVKHIHNKDFDTTNMVYSLYLAKNWLKGETFIVLYGDILFNRKTFKKLLDSNKQVSTIVEKAWLLTWRKRFADPLTDAESLKLCNKNCIIELGKKATKYTDIEGQYVGMTKFNSSISIKLWEYLDLLMSSKHNKYIYFTEFLQNMVDSFVDIHAIFSTKGVIEVDSCYDLEVYEQLYSQKQIHKIFEIDEVE